MSLQNVVESIRKDLYQCWNAFCSICVEHPHSPDNCNKTTGNGEIAMYGLGKKSGMIGDYLGLS